MGFLYEEQRLFFLDLIDLLPIFHCRKPYVGVWFVHRVSLGRTASFIFKVIDR